MLMQLSSQRPVLLNSIKMRRQKEKVSKSKEVLNTTPNSKQLTYTEYLQLKQDYITSNSIKKDRFAKLLSDFNNNKGIENKYEAVFPALCKWIEIEKRK